MQKSVAHLVEIPSRGGGRQYSEKIVGSQGLESIRAEKTPRPTKSRGHRKRLVRCALASAVGSVRPGMCTGKLPNNTGGVQKAIQPRRKVLRQVWGYVYTIVRRETIRLTRSRKLRAPRAAHDTRAAAPFGRLRAQPRFTLNARPLSRALHLVGARLREFRV